MAQASDEIEDKFSKVNLQDKNCVARILYEQSLKKGWVNTAAALKRAAKYEASDPSASGSGLNQERQLNPKEKAQEKQQCQVPKD